MRRLGGWSAGRIILGLVAGAMLAVVIVGGIAGWRVYNAALILREQVSAIRDAAPQDRTGDAAVSSQPSLQATEAAPTVAPPPSVIDTMRQACSQVADLERTLTPVNDLVGALGTLNQAMGQVPRIGEQASAVLVMAQAGQDIATGLQIACGATDRVLQQATSTDPSDRVGSALEELATQRDRLHEASARLRAAEARLASIDERVLDDRSRGLLVELRSRLRSATPRLALLAELPGILGYDGPRRYLVLGQNSDELRPTGGFIGTSGLLTFDRGHLVQQEFGSSFEWNVPFDRLVPPPAPLSRFMDAGYWHLREANWAPDFPSTAQQARYFVGLHSDEPLAGVIALDQDFVAQLLTVVGPTAVPGYDEVVTAENVRDRLDYQVHVVSGSTEDARKRFVSVLFPVLADRLASLPRDRLGDLVVAMNRALAGQSLLISVDDPAAQQALADMAWDGHLLSAPEDYLFLVNANIGANKINREVEQELEYRVSPGENRRLVGRASVLLKNRHPTDDPGPYATADYRDFMRLFVPLGSELVTASGFDSEPESATECGRMAFSGLVVVPPGQERRVEITYRLPATIDESNYGLVIQKQPGIASFPVRVRWTDTAESAVDFGLWTHHTLAPTAGGLAAARWVPTVPETSAPVCRVYNEPPRMLARPTEVAISHLDVRGAVESLGIQTDGVLEAPSSGDVVGWYDVSARPGQVGNMVVSGHLDLHKRPAIFWRLRELRPGDRIDVLDDNHQQYSYSVEWVREVDPTSAPLNEILGPTTEQWLTLITCGGPFDPRTGEYLSRTVVRAKLAESGPN